MMPLKQTLSDRVARAALDRFRRLWRPMTGWTVTVWLFGVLALAPLSSLLLGRLLITGDRVIIGNYDLAAWLFSPLGLLYLLSGGALLLIAGVLRYAGLFYILADDRVGHPVSVRRTALRLLVELPVLLRLSVGSAALGLLLLVPLLAGYGLIYTQLLGAHDINYYLDLAPTEWHQALGIALIWTTVWAVLILVLLLRLLLVLPAYLEGHRPLRRAVAESWSHTRGKSARILHLLGLGLVLWLLLRGLLTWALHHSAEMLIPGLGLPLRGMIYASAAHLLAGLALDALLSLAGFSLAATVLTIFYFEGSGLHHDAPPIPGMRRWPARTIRAVSWWLKPRRAFPTLALLLLSAAGLTLYQLHRVPVRTDFTITAHRAGMHLGPENSLATLERTIETGADYAEIDVQRTRDGVVVVYHDADLMRLARDHRRITETPYAELSEVDIGRLYHPGFEGLRLATLEEFLLHSRNRIKLNIELKYYGFDPALADACLELVEAYGMNNQVVFMSLNLEGIRQIRRQAPGIPIGFLSAVSAGDLARLDVDFVAVPQGGGTRSLIRTARRRAIAVHVWTVNRPERMVTFIDRGAEGLITDAPDVAADLRVRLQTLTPAEWILLRYRLNW